MPRLFFYLFVVVLFNIFETRQQNHEGHKKHTDERWKKRLSIDWKHLDLLLFVASVSSAVSLYDTWQPRRFCRPRSPLLKKSLQRDSFFQRSVESVVETVLGGRCHGSGFLHTTAAGLCGLGPVASRLVFLILVLVSKREKESEIISHARWKISSHARSRS